MLSRNSAIALILLAAGAAHAAERSVDRTFTVTPGGMLTVDADSASVRVTAADTNQVVVHASAGGSDEEIAAAKIDVFQKDDGVTVIMRQRGKEGWFHWWSSWHGDGQVQVTVPRRYAVNLRTGGGNVELADTEGSATLHTSGGDVVAKHVTGNVELRTSGGAILADSVRGDVDADTSGGDVRLLNVDGKIRGNTSGGNVRCSLAGVNRGISATTSGGDIELTLPRATAGNLDASTSGGDITTDLPVTTTAVKEGRLNGSLNGGGPPIEARTSGGGIALRVAN
jgi:Toastrack DUF4097